MPFDNEDLQRLKNNTENRFQQGHPIFGKEIILHPEDAQALLARLDAAEALIKVSPKSGEDITSFWEAWDAWKRSKGEGDR